MDKKFSSKLLNKNISDILTDSALLINVEIDSFIYHIDIMELLEYAINQKTDEEFLGEKSDILMYGCIGLFEEKLISIIQDYLLGFLENGDYYGPRKERVDNMTLTFRKQKYNVDSEKILYSKKILYIDQ